MLAFSQQLHELPTLNVGLVLTVCTSHSGMSSEAFRVCCALPQPRDSCELLGQHKEQWDGCRVHLR